MRAARVRISAQLICDLLGLPEGSEILYAYQRDGIVILIIEHESMPEADTLPFAEPIYRTEPGIQAAVFQDWGILPIVP